MEPTLRTAAQFAVLQRKKLDLAKRTDERARRELVYNVLAKELLDFELTKLRHRIEIPETIGPSSPSLEEGVRRLIYFTKSGRELGVSDLIEFHTIVAPPGQRGFRQTPAEPLTPCHQPLEAASIAGALARFLEWVQSQAFAEMHPVEQVTLSQIRLYEIYPFETFCEPTLSLFSYTFLVTAGFLPPLYQSADLPDFYLALDAAFGFSTQRLVDLNARRCERAYDAVLKQCV